MRALEPTSRFPLESIETSLSWKGTYMRIFSRLFTHSLPLPAPTWLFFWTSLLRLPLPPMLNFITNSNNSGKWIFRLQTSQWKQRFIKFVHLTLISSSSFFSNYDGKRYEMFCFIVCHRSDEKLKCLWPLESTLNLLQNLSNQDFLTDLTEFF